MATNRPNVIVLQEFKALSSSPTTPELNCLIAGPAYWIKDYPEDRAGTEGIQVPDYGVLNTPATGAPLAPITPLVLADAPNNKVGALVDAARVGDDRRRKRARHLDYKL
jgi:hypothetical protein